jgi:hypothetical protein
MWRVFALGIVVALLFAADAQAAGLSKRHARHEALAFTAPFVDLLDVDQTVTTEMVPARKCRRVSARTVACSFVARFPDGSTLHGAVRVHLQRDGLLGFLLPGWIAD